MDLGKGACSIKRVGISTLRTSDDIEIESADKCGAMVVWRADYVLTRF